MKWLLCSGLAALAAAIASWHACSLAGKSTADSAVGGDTVTAAQATAQRSVVQGIGYVEPVSEVRKLMMRTGGVIKRCYFQAGDTVRKGEVLIELDDATPRADLEVAQKQLAMVQAEADDVNAGVNPYRIRVAEQTVERLREKQRFDRSEAERYTRMLRTSAASQQDFDAADTKRRQSETELREQEGELLHLRNSVIPERKAYLQSKVRHAQAGLDAAQERIREMRLVAPFDGTLLKLLKREGEGVRNFEPEAVALFGDTSRLRVRAEIDERFVRRLAPGQEAVVYGRNLEGREYRGKTAHLERIMGDKTVFTRASSERKDLDVLQAVIDMGPEFKAPCGLQVDVRIECRGANGD